MKSILERIKEISNNEGISITALEQKIGASKGVLSRAIANGTDIQYKWVQILVENYPQYSTDWLIAGNGEMLRNQNAQKTPLHASDAISENIDLQDKYNDNSQINKTDTTFLISESKQRGYAPYYSYLKVSAGQYDLTTIEQSETPDSWIKFPDLTVDAWFPVIGCSMEPKIFTGDTVGVVDVHNWERLDPDKVYMIVTIYDRMIKHLRYDEATPEFLWAISGNQQEFKIYAHEIKRIYRVVFAGRLV